MSSLSALRMINTWFPRSRWSHLKSLSLNPTCFSINRRQHTQSQLVFTHLGKYCSTTVFYDSCLSATWASWSQSIHRVFRVQYGKSNNKTILILSLKLIYIPYVNMAPSVKTWYKIATKFSKIFTYFHSFLIKKSHLFSFVHKFLNKTCLVNKPLKFWTQPTKTSDLSDWTTLLTQRSQQTTEKETHQSLRNHIIGP
jgi:hypothetical protein